MFGELGSDGIIIEISFEAPRSESTLPLPVPFSFFDRQQTSCHSIEVLYDYIPHLGSHMRAKYRSRPLSIDRGGRAVSSRCVSFSSQFPRDAPSSTHIVYRLRRQHRRALLTVSRRELRRNGASGRPPRGAGSSRSPAGAMRHLHVSHSRSGD
jgi:hypothetical protein